MKVVSVTFVLFLATLNLLLIYGSCDSGTIFEDHACLGELHYLATFSLLYSNGYYLYSISASHICGR